MLFFSKFENPEVVLEPKRTGRMDGETKPGVYVKFYNHYCEISEKEKIGTESKIEIFKATPGFGVDYWQVDSRAAAKPAVGKPGVEIMPAELERQANGNALEKLTAAVGNIATVLAKVVEDIDGLKKGDKSNGAPDGVPKAAAKPKKAPVAKKAAPKEPATIDQALQNQPPANS